MTNAHDLPDTRFVRVRMADQRGHGITMTFLDGRDDDTPAEQHGLVEHVAKHDQAKAARLATLLTHLRAHEATVMAWLESDPANSAKFAKDPVGTVRTLLPDAPFDDRD